MNRDRQREQDIAAWLGRNRVRYILNLARDDPDMGTEYPAVPGTSGFKQVAPDWMLDSTNDDELPDDADDDECVWVLSLPIRGPRLRSRLPSLFVPSPQHTAIS